jgi:hypothetical protein
MSVISSDTDIPENIEYYYTENSDDEEEKEAEKLKIRQVRKVLIFSRKT